MILFLHLHRLKGTTVCVRVTFNRDGKFHPTIDVWIWLRAFFYSPNTMAHFRSSVKVKLLSVKNQPLFCSFINLHKLQKLSWRTLIWKIDAFTRKLFFVVINADDSHDTQSMQ